MCVCGRFWHCDHLVGKESSGCLAFSIFRNDNSIILVSVFSSEGYDLCLWLFLRISFISVDLTSIP